MALRQDNMAAGFRRDGSFIDQALETEFCAHTWQRDCRQLHAIVLPVAVVMVALIPLDGPTLGWNSPLFYGEVALRLVAASMCLITYLIFRNPPAARSNITLPFTTTLATNTVILYAIATGANGTLTGTPITIAVTLVFWAFAPLKSRQLLMASGSLCLGYLALLFLWFPIDYQAITIASTLLIMINALGLFYLRSRNMSERREFLTNRELVRTTQTLRQEISTRIAAEKNAGANEEIFKGVFVSCPVPLCLVDLRSQKLIRANKRMTALLGYPEDEWSGQPIRDLFVEDSVFEDVFRSLLEKQSVHHDEIRLKTKDGDHKWVLLSAQRFSMPDRETVLATFVDITDQKQKEIDLADATAEAEEANFAKSQFLANMSHELRTPLNAIIGFSDIMENEVFGSLGSDRYAGYISDIKSSGVHLLSIINEILDLSKIEAGNEDLQQEEVDLNEIVDIATRLVRHHAEEKSIVLETHQVDEDLILMGDDCAIKQIILNLLSNAIKFTSDGGLVTIRTEKIGSRLIVEISDNGIGIPEDQLYTVTEPFVQLESTLTNANTGTGLGLSIATRLAELHGGRIEIESAVGVGTTTRLILPHIKDDKIAV